MKKVYLETPEAVIVALKEGRTVKCTDCGDKYTLENGFLVEKSKGTWTINPPLYGFPGYYIEEPDELKLEVGKFYRTRSGNKVIVLHVDKNDISGFPVSVAVVGCTDTLYFVSRTGGHSNGFTSEWDIVEPLGE